MPERNGIAGCLTPSEGRSTMTDRFRFGPNRGTISALACFAEGMFHQAFDRCEAGTAATRPWVFLAQGWLPWGPLMRRCPVPSAQRRPGPGTGRRGRACNWGKVRCGSAPRRMGLRRSCAACRPGGENVHIVRRGIADAPAGVGGGSSMTSRARDARVFRSASAGS